MFTSIILIDFQEAFDTLDHEVLLKKWNILVFEHLQLNGLSPVSQTENVEFVLIIFFLGLYH